MHIYRVPNRLIDSMNSCLVYGQVMFGLRSKIDYENVNLNDIIDDSS